VFDEEFARLRGVPVEFFYLLLLVLVAVTVVLLIQVVGLILVLALLTLPAAVAGHYVHSLGRMMLIATLLGALLSISGLALSYGPDLPAGPTIILLAAPSTWRPRASDSSWTAAAWLALGAPEARPPRSEQ
jgi:zinc transport system permease protein